MELPLGTTTPGVELSRRLTLLDPDGVLPHLPVHIGDGDTRRLP
ncbi:hypothetical protein ACFO4E_10635 [Nocardiopsis mangrovi]|uniref:Uncharacterized protein n=1 Tax=Nocardiopsis mangrovi TaxID=1179818 RepID=A0ABV9DW09_9ACTN